MTVDLVNENKMLRVPNPIETHGNMDRCTKRLWQKGSFDARESTHHHVHVNIFPIHFNDFFNDDFLSLIVLIQVLLDMFSFCHRLRIHTFYFFKTCRAISMLKMGKFAKLYKEG